MRYQFLREGLRIIESAGKHLFRHRVNQEMTKDELDTLNLLRQAHKLIREELKHPERFNLDGTKRQMRVTLPPERKKKHDAS